MNDTAPQPIYAKDYRPPDYRIAQVFLEVILDPKETQVRARLEISAQGPSADARPPLVLDGEGFELQAIRMDGKPLADSAYAVGSDTLTIANPPARFSLEIDTLIDPAGNTALEGLYLSSGMYCTQCEAEGFRRITYFIDRPDNLALFTTRIVGDQATCPVLLSNGNPVATGTLEDGRHWAEWHDPFPKPSYLFALVAGDLACVEDSFVTGSGRKVDLRIYVEPGMEDRCAYAMDALKRSMRWDEDRFGLEYDLDIYMIVAVSHFNMGAMENKGLNVFNSKYVLASPDTATDTDFAGVERVIAHEYFHNWTGNRVTCRDWFQLSLKEGLTVFRDQEFAADMRSRPVQRIEDVRGLRARQFAEDSGPLAHPVRPQSYIEINNFYTATIYDKGAELVRMVHTLTGEQGFADGLRLYLERHDGTAATVEDFVVAMEDASGVDLAQFRTWYDQAGTPQISVSGAYDAASRSYAMTLTQHTQPTPGQPQKQPLHIPVRMGLLSNSGAAVALSEFDGAQEGVLSLTQAQQTVRFEGLDAAPTASLFREFSAPVIVTSAPAPAECAFLMANDPDPFNRWEAGQKYALDRILENAARLQNGKTLSADAQFIDAYRALLSDPALEKAFAAAALTLPSEHEAAQHMEVIDAAAIHRARRALRRDIAHALQDDLLAIYHANGSNRPYTPDADEAGRRALRNCALSYLSVLETGATTGLVMDHFRAADNMTDSMAALSLLSQLDVPQRGQALDEFHDRWKDDPLVLDKWFMVQAVSPLPGTLDRVRELLGAADFAMDNPNRVRALIGAFCNANPLHFHAPDGSGYRFFADQVLALNKINAQIAARLLTAIDQWRRHEPECRAHAQAQLQRIVDAPGLSADVYEIAGKTLGKN